MIKFTSSFTNLYGNETEVVTLETHEVSLSEVLLAFERFLKGAGYEVPGRIEIIGEDDE